MKTLTADPPDLERLALDVLEAVEECSRVRALCAWSGAFNDLLEVPAADLRYRTAAGALLVAYAGRLRAREPFSPSELTLLDQVNRTPCPSLSDLSGARLAPAAARSKGGAA